MNLSVSSAARVPLQLLDRPARNWFAAARDIAMATAGAAIAWRLAIVATGEDRPIFAAIAAIVALAPGVASHRKQALGMLVGVSIGIVIGEIARHAPGTDSTMRIAVVTLLTMFAASSFGLNAVMVIQAGASAVLVIGSTNGTVGFDRLVHTAIGGGVALLFTQVLFSVEPLGDVRPAVARLAKAAEQLLVTIAAGATDPSAHERLEAQLDELRAADEALSSALKSADLRIRWTVRGRWSARRYVPILDRVRAATGPLMSTLQSLTLRLIDERVPTGTLVDRARDALAALRTVEEDAGSSSPDATVAAPADPVRAASRRRS